VDFEGLSRIILSFPLKFIYPEDYNRYCDCNNYVL